LGPRAPPPPAQADAGDGALGDRRLDGHDPLDEVDRPHDAEANRLAARIVEAREHVLEVVERVVHQRRVRALGREGLLLARLQPVRRHDGELPPAPLHPQHGVVEQRRDGLGLAK
jgi:hypothetical protein